MSFPSSSVTSYTKFEPYQFSGATLTYGPFTDVKPYSTQALSTHYTNNSPFVTFTEVLKEIEVSHWGNIAVEEQYDMLHSGAVLKGGFSRIDYQVCAHTLPPRLVVGPAMSFSCRNACGGPMCGPALRCLACSSAWRSCPALCLSHCPVTALSSDATRPFCQLPRVDRKAAHLRA